MSEPKFTSGPWRVELVKGSYRRPALVLAGDKLVASCLGDQLKPDATSIGEATANARRIVQCVNAHDDLVAALANLLPRFEAACRFAGKGEEVIAETTSMHRAALAKAGEAEKED